jgi:transcriptional regulator with XRE-family HTH domain
MARSVPSRWESKFASFVRTYGAERLAEALDVDSSAIYHWIRGVNAPRPDRAALIQRLAFESGLSLSFEDVYGHVSKLQSSDQAIAAEIYRRKKKRAAIEEKKSARAAAAEFLVKSLTSRQRRAALHQSIGDADASPVLANSLSDC